MKTRVISFEEANRHAWHSLFDLMDEYQTEHPEASEDEAYEAVIWHLPKQEKNNDHHA